ncbi:hypothetical protein BT96DRAFT_949071 [Gymnopus androsaceus JB14]|uniref:Uncharacterized protein n=1 Tax=Gymnopus androsaceus JB14 TaxID=1447944 RepID=A0A6A4GME1_9AGAR|nr:hypothetical protein BT96DRAFT_949071 [Gymnopus androsaceus JB14]
MDRHEWKIKLSKLQYQAAWRALLALAGGMKGKVAWYELQEKDVQTMQDVEDSTHISKEKIDNAKRCCWQAESLEASLLHSKHHLEQGDASGSDKEDLEDSRSKEKEGNKDGLLHAGLQVEWCKAYARMRHWKEEILILEEEMQRMLVFLQWKASYWRTKAVVKVFTGAHAEGAFAYAHEQADVWESLESQFSLLWAQNDDGLFIMALRSDAWGDDMVEVEVDEDVNKVAEAVEGAEAEEEGMNREEEKGEEEKEEEDEEEDLDLEVLAVSGKYTEFGEY